MVSKTGYAKKLTPYCGPEAPKFEKSDFEKGKARWLVVFNNTGSDEQSELQLESPTIGYRSKILFLVSFIIQSLKLLFFTLLNKYLLNFLVGVLCGLKVIIKSQGINIEVP